MELDSLEVGGVIFPQGRGRDTFYHEFRVDWIAFSRPSFSFYLFYCSVLTTLSNPNILFASITDIFRSGRPTTFTAVQTPHPIIVIMEDLSEALARQFSLTAKEDGEVDVGSGSMGSEAVGETFDVVGRVVSEKIYSAHTLQQNLERLLRSVRGFRFQELGENRFVLRFNHRLDSTHALEGCPWLLDRNALLLAMIPPEGNPETLVLDEMNIVVRLNDIPRFCRNPETARKLCANFGSVLEVLPPKGEVYQSFIRVKVQVIISEPLLRGSHLRLRDGARKWIAFSYERLPLYCYLCGIIGHMEKKCQLRF